MKAYKIEILIIDHDELGEEGVVSAIQDTNYPNDCIIPSVEELVCVDIGEWSDDHPLNLNATCKDEYNRLFGGDK